MVTTAPGSLSQKGMQRKGFHLLFTRAILVHDAGWYWRRHLWIRVPEQLQSITQTYCATAPFGDVELRGVEPEGSLTDNEGE
ncbi:hypothetical protein EB72_24630 [Mycobacterium sp. SWH-M1]|nr:hypothetical protein EB72_24630 [Mycobacterium sp. SWH-M1]